MDSQPKKYAVFALFTACISILAFYIYRHRQGQTGPVDHLIISGMGSVQGAFFSTSRGVRGVWDHYVWLINTQKQNEELEKKVGDLQTQLAALNEVALENERLRKSLNFKESVQQDIIPAHVVAHDVSSDYFGIRIDKGSQHGIKVGMGVVSPDGVVGRVLRTSAHFSDVLTIADPASNIDGIIQRSRARGVITGQSRQLTCKMKYVDKLDDVVVGDTVVSSGFGLIFPKGLLIGTVTAATPSPNGILQTVIIKTAVDIYRLEEVLIVVPRPQSEKTAE